jgi:hypothetical protein
VSDQPQQRWEPAHVKAAPSPAASANNHQVGGDHYRAKTIQPWDFIAANDIGFLEGNAIKYLARWKEKGGIDDLRKARHYVDKLIELELAKQ